MASSALFRRALPPGVRFSQWLAGDGWPIRRFDLPAPAGVRPRGSILFQGGRGDFVEKYLELLAHWHAAGWALTSFDWRGQGGSGRLAAPHCGHIDRFDRYADDYRRFYAAWARDSAGPYIVMGHSMGGHLVLRALVEDAVRPDAAVLIAPMLGLHSPVGARGGELIAALMCRLGDPKRQAWKANEIPGAQSPRQALLTHDADRYADELWWREADSRLDLGPPSWQWVREAFASTRRLRNNPALDCMEVPTLMLVADADRLVDSRAAVALAKRLPDCELIRFGDESAHEILRESDEVRDRAIGAIDAFLAAMAAA